MATKDVAFSITDQATNATVASGTIVVDDSDDKVVGISGTANGVAIDGLSPYGGADDALSERPKFIGTGVLFYGYGVDQNGLGFTAGGTNYNLHATSQTNNNLGQASQTGDALTGSDGSTKTVSFTAGSARMLCFVQGTKLRTVRGDVAVEELLVGDTMIASSGRKRSIVWIGHREITAVAHEAEPVRISAGAFGSDLPLRDLLLSPGHPVLVGADEHHEGGHLVPIMCLINGTTIQRLSVARVTYWHVELDRHDILLAEGLPAESYIDLGSRAWFAGADGALHDPDTAAPGMPGRCRPVAIDGPVVAAERRRLDALFEMRLAAACAWPSASGIAPA